MYKRQLLTLTAYHCTSVVLLTSGWLHLTSYAYFSLLDASLQEGGDDAKAEHPAASDGDKNVSHSISGVAVEEMAASSVEARQATKPELTAATEAGNAVDEAKSDEGAILPALRLRCAFARVLCMCSCARYAFAYASVVHTCAYVAHPCMRVPLMHAHVNMKSAIHNVCMQWSRMAMMCICVHSHA